MRKLPCQRQTVSIFSWWFLGCAVIALAATIQINVVKSARFKRNFQEIVALHGANSSWQKAFEESRSLSDQDDKPVVEKNIGSKNPSNFLKNASRLTSFAEEKESRSNSQTNEKHIGESATKHDGKIKTNAESYNVYPTLSTDIKDNRNGFIKLNLNATVPVKLLKNFYHLRISTIIKLKKDENMQQSGQNNIEDAVEASTILKRFSRKNKVTKNDNKTRITNAKPLHGYTVTNINEKTTEATEIKMGAPQKTKKATANSYISKLKKKIRRLIKLKKKLDRQLKKMPRPNQPNETNLPPPTAVAQNPPPSSKSSKDTSNEGEKSAYFTIQATQDKHENKENVPANNALEATKQHSTEVSLQQPEEGKKAGSQEAPEVIAETATPIAATTEKQINEATDLNKIKPVRMDKYVKKAEKSAETTSSESQDNNGINNQHHESEVGQKTDEENADDDNADKAEKAAEETSSGNQDNSDINNQHREIEADQKTGEESADDNNAAHNADKAEKSAEVTSSGSEDNSDIINNQQHESEVGQKTDEESEVDNADNADKADKAEKSETSAEVTSSGSQGNSDINNQHHESEVDHKTGEESADNDNAGKAEKSAESTENDKNNLLTQAHNDDEEDNAEEDNDE